MSKAHTSGVRVGFVNFFGALAYLSVAFQLVLVVLLYFKWIYEFFIGPVKDIVPQAPPPVVVEPVVSTHEPSVWMFILGILIVGIMIALCIYAIIKTPSMISKAGSKVITGAANRASGAVLQARHKKDTPKNRKKLAPRLVLVFKFVGVFLPLLLSWLAQFLPERVLDFRITLVLAVGLAVGSFILFAVQYLLGIALKVERKSLR